MRTLIWALLIPVAAFAAENTDQQSKKIEITYSLSGPEMYKTFCASCHGTEGKGNGPAAAALKTAPADLTTLAKKNGGFPRDRVRNAIEGKNAKELAAHGSREMPIWGDVFRGIANDNAAITYRVTTLTSYVESLQGK